MALTMQRGQSVSEGTYTPPAAASNSSPAANASTGASSSSYTSFSDMFDGGGPGRSGARFSSGDTGAYDTDQDGYISEAEYALAQANNPNFADTQGGIAALSNSVGARPYGSYQSEIALGDQGRNIGTSGIASFVTNGIAGNILNALTGKNLGLANKNMPSGMPFSIENLVAQGMTPEEAQAYILQAQQSSGLGMQQPAQNSIPATPSPTQILAYGGLAGLAKYMYGGLI